MCFSATVSYSAGALLVPAGLYCVKQARALSRPYWVVSMIPLFFGIQQIFEGRLWQLLEASDAGGTRLAALGFMFFSHLLWLFWIPLSGYLHEDNAQRKKLFLGTMFGGVAVGLSMYLPLLLFSDWLSVYILQHSIVYQATLIYDDYLPRIVVRGIYAVVVIVPLLLSSNRFLRMFGIIIAISVAFSVFVYGYAFISVWCFFAAMLSLYILYMIIQVRRS
jgi:hypothetical protein